jgi:hypothetical protein
MPLQARRRSVRLKAARATAERRQTQVRAERPAGTGQARACGMARHRRSRAASRPASEQRRWPIANLFSKRPRMRRLRGGKRQRSYGPGFAERQHARQDSGDGRSPRRPTIRARSPLRRSLGRPGNAPSNFSLLALSNARKFRRIAPRPANAGCTGGSLAVGYGISKRLQRGNAASRR